MKFRVTRFQFLSWEHHVNDLHHDTDDYDDRRPAETPDERLKTSLIKYGEVVRQAFFIYMRS